MDQKNFIVAIVLSVLIILALNAEVFLVRGAESFSIGRFLYNFALQIVQPMTWPDPWQPM